MNAEYTSLIEAENVIYDLVAVIKRSELINAKNDSDALYLHDYTIAALGNMVSNKVFAVKAMISGSIQALFDTVYNSLNSKEPLAISRLNTSIFAIATHAFSSTVRNLISQILFVRQKELSLIVNQCVTNKINYAYYYATMIAFLSLNIDNLRALQLCDAFEKLRGFCNRDPIEPTDDLTFFVSVIEIEQGHLILFDSKISEVITYVLWVLARFSCGVPKIANASVNSIPLYIKQNLLQQIRMFTHSSDKRIRELSHIILANIGDKYINKYGDIQKWVLSLDFTESEQKTIIKQFLKEKITLYQLLNPLLESKDEVMALFNKLDLKSGDVIQMKESILQLRSENEQAQKRIDEIVKIIKSKESELANTSKIDKDKDVPSTDSPKKNEIFLSYSWANKQQVKKLNATLVQKGFSCWIDEGQMQGGTQLFGAIDNGISDCKVFLACCSNNYGSSVNCQRELLLATDRNKIIIPIIVGPCDPWPPKGQMGPLLAGKLYVDLSTDEKFEKTVDQLIAAINQVLC